MQPTLLSGIKSVPINLFRCLQIPTQYYTRQIYTRKIIFVTIHQFTLTSENSGSYGAEFGRNKCGGRRQPLW